MIFNLGKHLPNGFAPELLTFKEHIFDLDDDELVVLPFKLLDGGLVNIEVEGSLGNSVRIEIDLGNGYYFTSILFSWDLSGGFHQELEYNSLVSSGTVASVDNDYGIQLFSSDEAKLDYITKRMVEESIKIKMTNFLED